jgi:hypothetical protein
VNQQLHFQILSLRNRKPAFRRMINNSLVSHVYFSIFTHFDNTELKLSLGPDFDPLLDGRQGLHFLLEALQLRVLGERVPSGHHVEHGGSSRQDYVSPRQLQNRNQTTHFPDGTDLRDPAPGIRCSSGRSSRDAPGSTGKSRC